MERQRQVSEQRPLVAGDPLPDHDLDSVRIRAEEMLRAADRALDSIDAVNAEQFLQQSRQRGAQ